MKNTVMLLALSMFIAQPAFAAIGTGQASSAAPPQSSSAQFALAHECTSFAKASHCKAARWDQKSKQCFCVR